MAKYERNNNPDQVSPGFPARATDGGKLTWTTETDGAIVDKRGFGIIAFAHAAFGTAVSGVVEAGNASDGSDFQDVDGLSFDLTVAENFDTDKLAAWPFFRVVLNAGDTDSMIVGMT